MRFHSRFEAGQLLGKRLRSADATADLVLGLPRGGVVVAAEVAHCLDCQLATLVVRKIGHPQHRELAVGAIAEPDIVVRDEESLRWNPPSAAALHAVEAEEMERLRRYQKLFHSTGLPELKGKEIWLVDDGLATGATMEAAVRAARKRHATRVKVAVPVASSNALTRIAQLADDVVALEVDAGFLAVGRYYEEFRQVTDEEVVSLLRAA
ncbi:MAG: phosphoribosyltransferase family protein [Verrucomicrobiota bacterium]